jgi:catechol 2,3-dioxygenase-like lactoylglutathione lyase family enzyme
MPTVTWDHVHLRSPDPEATATWLHDILGGEIVRGPGRIDVKLGGANVFIAPVATGDAVNSPPVTPYQGLDHFGLTVKDIDAVAAEIKAKGVELRVNRPPSGPACASASSAARRAFRSSCRARQEIR